MALSGLIRKNWKDAAFTAAVFLAVLSLPLLLGIDYRLTGRSTVITYRLIWNFLVSGQRPPFLVTETPKPLICLLYHLLPVWGVYLLIAASVALSGWALSGISKQMTGKGFYGGLAFLCILIAFPASLRNILFCYWEWPYLGLTLAAFWAVVSRKHMKYAVLMLLSGLIRPESWLFAFAFPLLLYFHEGRRWEPLWWLPAAAPLLWAGFDLMAFGDPLYSLMITARYKDFLGVSPLDLSGLLRSLPGTLMANAGLPASVLGLAGLAVGSFRPGSDWRHRLFLAAAVLPPLFYLVLAAFGSIIFMERFILITNVTLVLYALILLPLSRVHPKWSGMGAALLAAGLTAGHLDSGAIKAAVHDSAQERRKTARLEECLPALRDLADSLNGNIIVPYRRKMTAAYLLPSPYHGRLHSFREIVYQNAVNGEDVNRYAPAGALFLEDDFTGLENGFSFLSGPGRHHLVGYLYFHPLLRGPGYTVYAFVPDTVWAPPRQFETR